MEGDPPDWVGNTARSCRLRLQKLFRSLFHSFTGIAKRMAVYSGEPTTREEIATLKGAGYSLQDIWLSI